MDDCGVPVREKSKGIMTGALSVRLCMYEFGALFDLAAL
jgi:hypothetical protein